MRRIALLALLLAGPAMAQVNGPLLNEAAYLGVSEPLQTIAMRAQTSAFAPRPVRPSRNHTMDKSETVQAGRQMELLAPSLAVTAPATYLQTSNVQALGVAMGANFEALGLGTPGFAISGAPPDTTLAVSPTQIVQWVNSQLAVYDKAGTPQLPAPGFVAGNYIWQGLPDGSLCKTFNRGDPIVQYDRMAGRWILSQFAFNAAFTNNAQCIAVSQTNNAMGAYYLYEYNFGNVLPDYGKLAVWPDAYYLTYNMFTTGSSFAGGRACAYDRAAMMTGSAATQICFQSAQRFSFLPADLDGPNPPPAGTPNIHVSWNYYWNPAAPYTLQLTKFRPNFTTPALSTFDDGFGGAPLSFVGITTDAATVAACNDAGGSCVPQPGTTQRLDTLADRHMYRLVYRNFGSYDALLLTQSVDSNGSGGSSRADLHWMEVRSPNANPPVVYQNSTYRADSTHRWMSSAAFDKLGNIGIGYSGASAAVKPDIRVNARKRADPRNLLRTEAIVQAGGGSQTTGLSRWGDYSTMQIDPADDCTFWFTTQYIGANGTFNWRTRIASFKFPNCQ